MGSQEIISLYDTIKRRFTKARCKTVLHPSAGKLGKMHPFLGMSKWGAQTRRVDG
jgi:hypothetical protein